MLDSFKLTDEHHLVYQTCFELPATRQLTSIPLLNHQIFLYAGVLRLIRSDWF